MRYPEFLKEKGTIGFAAPSFGCNIEPYRSGFDRALEKFEALGYRTQLGPNCYEGKGIGISNTPKLCGEELSRMYESEKNDVLISCGGGELMCEILDYVDFEGIRNAKPKWYMGYSDNTNFTFLLTTLCDVASVYGPCAGTFGMEPWHQSLKDSMALLEGKKLEMSSYGSWEKESLKDKDHPYEPYNLTEKTQIKTFFTGEEQKISFSGRLIGGCMDCLVNLLGTSYDQVRQFCEKYREDGIIWYLEACDLNVFGIRRAVWQMIHAGWFQHVKGFLIGRPYHFGEDLIGLDQYHAVCDLLQQYQVPVLMDLDIGHLAPMMTLINGSLACVSTDGAQIQIRMELK